MPAFLRGPVLGVLVGTLFALNTLFWFVPIILLSLLKRLMPTRALERFVGRANDACAQSWVGCNKVLAATLLPTRYDIRGVETLDCKAQYFICSNHQTWNDIHVLQQTFYGKAPFFKFFLKQELIWVPVLGLAWWGLDFPFMRRSTPEQIAKNPALKGKDIETTRRTCEKYQGIPVAIFNFLEGTRFTPSKHNRQQSPYQHLLKPKAGGFAFTLAAMGGQLSSLLDVTIVYPDGAKTFGQFLCGHVGEVIVEVQQREIPAEFAHGDYEGDAAFRKRVQDYVAMLWTEKDARISALLAERSARR
jgi:1-acyl-sn-glycerol-3-phosphate acyltransferase